MDMKNINLLGIIALIGAIILIAGVFMDWFSVTTDASPLGKSTEHVSGWKIFDDTDSDKVNYTWAPVVCLVLGIISLVLMIVPTVMNTEKFETINNILGIVALILAVVAVIATVLFMTQKIDGYTIKELYEANPLNTFKWGSGFYMCLAGGIITLVGGLMPIIKNKLM